MKHRVYRFLQYGVDTLTKIGAVVREELAMTPAKRKAREAAKAAEAAERWRKASESMGKARSTSTAVVTAKPKLSWWQIRWEALRSAVASHWAVQRLGRVREHPVMLKGQELAEDLRDRWETSDSPVVHRIQDLNESLFGETATAMAFREIRRRDPMFSFSDFISEMQEDVEPILKAYLKGDLEYLRTKCSREVVERCAAERRVLAAQGMRAEDKILHISDVELRETKLVGKDPVIILNFRTQQIHCVVDRHGSITEGGRDDILTVFYAWAMQQAPEEEVAEANAAGAAGAAGQPKWRLREMQQLGMQALI